MNCKASRRNGFMKLPVHLWRPAMWSSAHASRRRPVSVIVSLSLFVIQFSLSLVLHPMTQILCLDELSSTSKTSAHTHHHDDAIAHTETEPSGATMRHCKDTLYGVAVTPMQPFHLPSTASVETPASAWAILAQDFEPVVDRTVPPPYQPPQA